MPGISDSGSGGLRGKLRSLWCFIDAVGRAKAADALAIEIEELENIFSLLVLGAFVGLPSPPIHLTMDLMPVMPHDFERMMEKIGTAHDPLGLLFSSLGIG
jgi:hypothetical protein